MHLRQLALIMFIANIIGIFWVAFSQPVVIRPAFIYNYPLQYAVLLSFSMWFFATSALKITAALNYFKKIFVFTVFVLLLSLFILNYFHSQVNILAILEYRWWDQFVFFLFFSNIIHDIGYVARCFHGSISSGSSETKIIPSK